MTSGSTTIVNDPIPLLRKPFLHDKILVRDGDTVGSFFAIGTRDTASTSFGDDDAMYNFLAVSTFAASRDVVVSFTEITNGGTITAFSAEVSYWIVPPG